MEIYDLREIEEQVEVLFKRLEAYACSYVESQRKYRMIVASEMEKLRSEKVPATMCEILAKGNREVATAKVDLESNRLLYEITMSKYQWLKMKYKEYQTELAQEWEHSGKE